MNILHYLNVIIGFSLVMLILSIVTSFTAQIWLVAIKTKARTVGNGLSGLLEDIGFEKEFAKQNVNELLDKDGSRTIGKFGGALNRISAYFLASAPKNIGREEFLLLLLRRARTDKRLAAELGFKDEAAATAKLQELEEQILAAEAKDPKLPAQVWRTKAMQMVVPGLASKIFARFDEVMDRATEEVSAVGKFLGLLITLPLLLLYWPVDAMVLINRLSNDQVLANKVANLAEGDVKRLQMADDNLLKCRENNDPADRCEREEKERRALSTNLLSELDQVSGLFGGSVDEKNKVESGFFKGYKMAVPTPGIFVTWILVSLGSAYWLGLLNKMLGIRSEFANKLEEQREYRATSQQ